MPIIVNLSRHHEVTEEWWLRDFIYHTCSTEPLGILLNGQTGERLYVCPQPGCPLGNISALLLEGLVWATYVRQFPYADRTPEDGRGTLVRITVERIDLGETVADITLHPAGGDARAACAA